MMFLLLKNIQHNTDIIVYSVIYYEILGKLWLRVGDLDTNMLCGAIVGGIVPYFAKDKTY